MASTEQPIPLHLIAGPLGAGKTTAILHYLEQQAGQEHIAVVVNDFGSVGVDQSILGAAAPERPPTIKAIPGGCLCCTTPIYLEQALQQLAQEPAIDRIFIEPSGVVLLARLKQDVQRITAVLPVRLHSTVTLIPPGRIKETHYQALPFFRQLIDEADYLVANRCDQVTPEQQTVFREWTARLTPPKKAVWLTEFGRLPPHWFRDAAAPTNPSASAAMPDTHGQPHEHSAHDQQMVRGHWEAAADDVWDLAPLLAKLATAVDRQEQDGLLRCKGVIHTADGWRLLQWTEEGYACDPFPPQPVSRLEWICASPAAAAEWSTRLKPIRHAI